MSNIPLPWSYVYRYPDGALRMSGGCEVNGSKPVEAIGVYLAPTLEAAEARVRELEAEVATMEARAVAADLAVVKAAKVATTEAYERAAEVADCHADECDAASFASTVAEQVSALRSKEQAAHGIATAIRKLAQEVKHEAK